jgi:hypothetical protein
MVLSRKIAGISGGNRGKRRKSYEQRTMRTTNQIMQNETNLRRAKINTNSSLIKNYEMNKLAIAKKTNPIKPTTQKSKKFHRPNTKYQILNTRRRRARRHQPFLTQNSTLKIQNSPQSPHFSTKNPHNLLAIFPPLLYITPAEPAEKPITKNERKPL